LTIKAIATASSIYGAPSSAAAARMSVMVSRATDSFFSAKREIDIRVVNTT
jgi:hypothetical protein